MKLTLVNGVEIFLIVLISLSPLVPELLKGLLVGLLVWANMRNKRKLSHKRFLYLAVFVFLFLVGAAWDLRNISSLSEISLLGVFFPLTFMLGYLISGKYTLDSYLVHIEKIAFVTALLSLIGVVVYTFFPSLIEHMILYRYHHTVHRTALIFNVLISEAGVAVPRNSGIAWEPGAFQILLNLGLYACLKLHSSTKLYKVGVYSLAIWFTMSTAGLIIYAFVMMRLWRRGVQILLLGVLFGIAFRSTIFEMIDFQMRYKLWGTTAFEFRLQTFIDAFRIGWDQILGYGNAGLRLRYAVERQAPWDSYGQIFLRYGYPLLTLIVFRILRIAKASLPLFVIIAVSFSAQGVWFLPMITPFYFWHISSKGMTNENSLVH